MGVDSVALDIMKCSFCGRAFVDANGQRPICADCRDEEERLYKKARDLILDNPGRALSVSAVAEILGVEESKINYFVDHGLFHLVQREKEEECAVLAELLKEKR
jgi:predicted AAA+ superfamily ATPase